MDDKFIDVICTEFGAFSIRDEYGDLLQIGTLIHDRIRISKDEIINLPFVQDHIEEQVEYETEELNDEIATLFKLLNRKDEEIEKLKEDKK